MVVDEAGIICSILLFIWLMVSSLLHVGSPRPPFDDLIQRLVSLHSVENAPQRKPAIISVDIPSGWHVEGGDVNGHGIKPDMLVSI